MRTIFTSLIIALFLSIGSANSFAAPDKGHRHEPPRREQNDRHKHKDHKKKDHKKDHKKDYKKHDHKKYDHKKDYKKHGHKKHDKHSAPRPGFGGHHAPPPPPPPHHHGKKHHHHPDRLGPMVRYATRGCHDVDVWRIDDESYIVRYRKGHKYYTRRIYPYTNRYGAVTVIAPNWQPLSPWINIPPVQININI